MKKLIILIALSLAGCCIPYETAHGEEITKADILKTVQHIQQLAQEQKNELDKAQWDYQQQGEKLATATALAAEKTKEAHDNAKQRDVLIYVFALSIGLYALQATSSLIPEQSGWFSIIAKVVVFFAAFGAAYAFGRFVLAWASSFIP